MSEGWSLGTTAFHILPPPYVFLATFLIIPVPHTIIFQHSWTPQAISELTFLWFLPPLPFCGARREGPTYELTMDDMTSSDVFTNILLFCACFFPTKPWVPREWGLLLIFLWIWAIHKGSLTFCDRMNKLKHKKYF